MKQSTCLVFLQPQEIFIQCLTHEPPTGNNTTQKNGENTDVFSQAGENVVRTFESLLKPRRKIQMHISIFLECIAIAKNTSHVTVTMPTTASSIQTPPHKV